MYKHVDQTWRDRPQFMADETVGALARRLSDYVKEAGLTSVTVLLHGGEPLLAGAARLRRFLETIHGALAGSGCVVEFSMQTNGVLLTEELLELFDRWNVTFGISLDGDEDANDRWRKDHGGGSSHSRVIQAIKLVADTTTGRRLFRGLLTVIDVRNDPLKTFNFLKDLAPPRLDFLFPDGTRDNPPPLPSLAKPGRHTVC